MDKERLQQITAPLLTWFAEHARDLPWRIRPTAYRVWVSEIMLQQARVEAVKPFYARFMEALPDVTDLAACPEDRLLKLWEGLGYYSRVRNMQKAARMICEQYGGVMPVDYETLLTLPGIGSYTAGAIASIAGGEAAPAVDGNVLRVVTRICESRADITKQSVKKEVEADLRQVMPKEHPGAFNQAMMELGATVCAPNGAPDCAACPVRQLCLSGADGSWTEIPVKAPKKPRRIEARTVLVIRDTERAVIQKRPKKGLLAGLYELPNAEGHLSADEALKAVRRMGFSPIRIHPLPEAKHIFSHIEWQMQGYLVLVEDADAREAHTPLGNAQELLFVEPSRTERDYPIPAAFAAYVTSLDILLGQEKFDEAGETTVRNRLELACGRIQREKGDKNENSYDCNSVL